MLWRQWMVAVLAISPLTPASAQMSERFAVDLAAASGLSALRILRYPPASYAGRDESGVPRYVQSPFSAEERRLLRRWFGIEDPNRLYLSDSSGNGYLVYDTERDPGAARLVRSYRVGAPSIRLPEESWEQLERRLRRLKPRHFPASARTAVTSLDSLAPDVRDRFSRMVADARAAGHRVRVAESWRSPERQAYLLVLGGGLTFTATSMHSAGRAIDLVVGDGKLGRARTRAQWIAFRRWLSTYDGGRFRMIGTPERSWDWPHVELAEGLPGFRSVEELLRAARDAETMCCEGFAVPVHSSDDPARSGAAALPGAGGRDHALRVDGAAGGAPLPAR
ncbi:MAG TPA: hypothetical protein VEB59_12735 [Gemmatimonadales bacterium]|nr:hypothetical protein [Gemmatimonadales bacterium]